MTEHLATSRVDSSVSGKLFNCRSRPWERHKYATPEEQAERLPFLLSWVSEYYRRDGDLSLAGHQALFDAYPGPKLKLPATMSPEK